MLLLPRRRRAFHQAVGLRGHPAAVLLLLRGGGVDGRQALDQLLQGRQLLLLDQLKLLQRDVVRGVSFAQDLELRYSSYLDKVDEVFKGRVQVGLFS